MTSKQRLFLLLLWIVNIALLLAVCIPTGLHTVLALRLRRRNAVSIYCAAGILLARLEMYLYFKLKGE